MTREATMQDQALPIVENKAYAAASVFTPENLLREAWRQKAITEGNVLAICVLDPDGDMVDYLVKTQQAQILDWSPNTGVEKKAIH